MECTEIADTILMDAGTVDASMYNAIQQKIFNATWTACHGLSTTPGGGLNLLEGQDVYKRQELLSIIPMWNLNVIISAF